ncbi:hypothetical protein KIL84_003939 [Mauremys mutica]|uniref:SPIN-DOC-like zinc-finger domain-containing protein n=1 Tax=Mauremys mutica TaxID=74926 RepID=A0A9D3WV73_9SAUR|nr:hypothetical protein KIL84_003939 [Mauremys mutica]
MEVKAEVPRLEYIAVSLKCEAEEQVPIAACAQLCAPVGDLAPGVKLEEADKEPLDRVSGGREIRKNPSIQERKSPGDRGKTQALGKRQKQLGKAGTVRRGAGNPGECGKDLDPGVPRLRRKGYSHHGITRRLRLSPSTVRCTLQSWQARGKAPPAPSPPQARPFDPAWRADFLMDYDAGAGTMVCMVCEYSLLPIRLGTVMRHIRQCHAETLHLPRGVRRAIREVWETRGPVPAPPQHGALKGE